MKNKPTHQKPANQESPTFKIIGSSCKQEVQEIPDWKTGLPQYAVVFPAEVEISVLPSIDFRGVGTVVINGVRFHKPIT